MRRVLLAFVASIGLVSLSGCVSQPRYVERDGGDYYYDEPGPDAVVGYLPDYFAYSAYYSALWPVYCPWWDAFCDSFHYGVTFFPHRYFGAGFGYGYGFVYSPWYGSWWDSYYDWNWWHHRHASQRAYSRFGSAQNEARAVAMLSRDAAAPHRAGLLLAPQGRTAGSGGMDGATLRARSTPLRATGEAAWPRGDAPAGGRAVRDPYYGVPVRGSVGRHGEGRVLPSSDHEARPPRSGVAVGDERRPIDVDTPRAWAPRDEAMPARLPREAARPASRQDVPRFVPRGAAADGAPVRGTPVMHPAPSSPAMSAPVHSAPASAPPARAGRDDGGH